jgi:GDPmannose 4,6-dehydratase
VLFRSDGHHLAKLLLEKKYTVYGMVNRQREELADDLGREFPQLIQVRGDLADAASLRNIIQATNPDEIYNLGGISFVGMSFQQPELTANITGLGVLRILEAVRNGSTGKQVRIFQASSSEMYGKVKQIPQNENTPFHPRSPYGASKAFAHFACVNYREAYGMHVSCGIMFNHEGERRGTEFVTRKITKALARVKLGLQNELLLGNLDAKRDWGYAGDYVQAMWLMLQQAQPDDYVIATGKTHSIREFLNLAAEILEISNLDSKVRIDPTLYRPAEVDLLIGDASKAAKQLGWYPQVGFYELVKKMVLNDLAREAEISGKPVPKLNIK